MIALSRHIRAACDLAGAKRAVVETVSAMLEEQVPAHQILCAITAINLDLHRQVFKRGLGYMRCSGISKPPVPITVIVMGSAGRGESFLGPDQDNGFILGDYPDEDHSKFDPYFIALAERFNNDLASVGFPLCEGGVMARNPVWRKTAAQWGGQLDRWACRRDPVAVRFADALADFRAIAGPPELAHQLRARLTRAFLDNPALVE